MNLSLILLLALFGAATSQKLTPAENQHLQSICGTLPKESSRRMFPEKKFIKGGIAIPSESAPFAFRVQIGIGLCSGTLISYRHFLTARHCLDDNFQQLPPGSRSECIGSDRVYTGVFHQVTIFGPNGEPLPVRIRKIVIPNGCVTGTKEDDIMVLEFDNIFGSFPSANPACILRTSDQNILGSTVKLFAYGSTASDPNEHKGDGVLQYGVFRINGAFKYGKMLQLSDPYRFFETRPGDSGGGYIKRIGKKATIVGVHSSTAHHYNMQLGANVGYYYNSICYHTGIC